MRTTTLDGIELTDRNTLSKLLKAKKIYTLDKVAEIVDRCPRYLRKLCHAGVVDHHKLLGRYYMTPVEVANLMTPVSAVGRAAALAAKA